MPTLNKETKNKALMLKLNTEQHVFVVKKYHKTGSYLQVKQVFHRRLYRKTNQ